MATETQHTAFEAIEVVSEIAVSQMMGEFKGNTSNETTTFDELGIPWVPISVMIIVLVFGVVANLSIVFIVLKNPRLRTTPNIIVVNLTIGDLLCLVVNLPFMIGYHIQTAKYGWVFGIFMCKFAHSSMVTSGCVTVFSLMALAIERYLAIRWPWRNRDSNRCVKRSRSFCLSPTWQIIFFIWVGAILVGAPIWKTADVITYPTGDSICMYISHGANIAGAYKICRIMVAYVIPLVIIVLAHTLTAWALLKSIREPVIGATDRVCHGNRQTSRERSRVKLAVVISVLSIMFFISWFPFYMFEIWFEFFYGKIFENPTMLEFFRWKDIPIYILSCLNPIMLYVLSTRFREHLLRDCFCQKIEWRPGEKFGSIKSSFLTASTFRSRSTHNRRSSPTQNDRGSASTNEFTKL